jgi:hypothetical protein
MIIFFFDLSEFDHGRFDEVATSGDYYAVLNTSTADDGGR